MADPTQKKALIFISAGLGDAILLVPLASLLRRHGYSVTGICTSPYPCEQIFEDTPVFDGILIARTKARKAWLAVKEYRNYDLCIVNYFAASRSNLLLAKSLGTMVHTNHIPDNAGKKLSEGVVYFEPGKNIHDAEQNMLLAGKGNVLLTEDLLKITRTKISPFPLPERFVALQLSAGTKEHPYKNWAISNWITFLCFVSEMMPELSVVLLGSSDEKETAEKILGQCRANLTSLAGKTTVRQAMLVISQSSLFLGPDGGLMHAAASSGVPTLSLWGPSNPVLYGYEQMNPEKHRVLSLNLSCSPCSSWISANTSRFTGPEHCPGKECLSELKPEQVFREFTTFVKKHSLV